MIDFIQKGRASVIIDGQWGSTGKGLIAAWLALQNGNYVDVATTNASANAGHTTCFADGRKFITYHLPTFAVIQGCPAYLNAGSVIDPGLLMHEMEECGVSKSRLFVHPHAAVITPEDKESERKVDSSNTKISSTQKGVGTALARKIRREATLAQDHPYLKDHCRILDLHGVTTVVEVPQGFDLSLNHGNCYPYVTSRDITVAAALSDAGLHPSALYKTLMSVRTFPIRVGNIMDEDGNEIGQSGPHYFDQKELQWKDLGQTPERTTVTKRIRRIFTWSSVQYGRALRMLRPDFVFINFINYCKSVEHLDQFLYGVMSADIDAKASSRKIFGCGPNVEDVFMDLNKAKERLWPTS
jgi:adenylosuccinate synthase